MLLTCLLKATAALSQRLEWPKKHESSRRQAQRITAKAKDLTVQDFKEINIERPQMVAKLLVNLEQGMQKGLINNQSSGVAACARQIILLAGLSADS